MNIKKINNGTHEVAKALFDHPDMELEVSIDISTGVIDKHGDEVIAKIFAHDVVETICANNGVTILFGGSSSGGEGVDVLEVVKAAQKQLSDDMNDSPNGYVKMTQKEFEALSAVVASASVKEPLDKDVKKGVSSIKAISKRNGIKK